MVSLKRYLNRNEEETALRQVVSLLLEKIGSEAPVGDQAECAAFRSDIDRLRESLDAEATAQNILLMAGSAAQALAIYNKGITKCLRTQGRELQNIIRMMGETVATIAGENACSAEKLREIGDRLETANAMQDLDSLKLHLVECLQTFRQGTLRQKEQMESVITELRLEIERGPRQRIAEPELRNIDKATGLAAKDVCVKAMHEAIPPGKRRYIVTFVVNRVQAINARFGHEAGDRLLCAFGEFIEQQILPVDKLFRWSGPALVALLERSETLEQIRTQVKRMLEARLEETFEVDGRSVLIPISAAWSAFQLITTVATAERQILTFVASQGSHEFV